MVDRWELTRLRLPLARRFETARGTATERRVGLLRLTDSDGFTGLGEVTPLPHTGPEALDELLDALDAHARPLVEGADVANVANVIDRVGPALPPVAMAALDCAWLDLEGQRTGTPLARLLSEDARDAVTVNATIAAAAPEDVADAAARAVEDGFSTIKLKVGFEDDVDRVAALRERVGYSVRLRVDANGGWWMAEAIEKLRELMAFGLELVEQPVKPDDLFAMRTVRESVAVPVVADEGVRDGADLHRHLHEAACDGITIKVAQAGGPSHSEVLASAAAKANLFAYVSSSLDGPVGLAAGLHFAASRPEIELACGLATADVFEQTYAVGPPEPQRGVIALPDAPGLGITVDEDALRELVV